MIGPRFLALARRLASASIFASVAALVGCAMPQADAPPARHVVLVTLDTVRADRLGCYGRSGAQTPWLDGLAARGVRFERAYAQSPLTLPSHMSILTGLRPTRTGVHVNGQTDNDPAVTSLAQRLAGEGFYTAAAVGGFPVARRFPVSHGFERFDDTLADRRNPAGLERDATAVVKAALDLLPQRGDRRLFLWVHLFDAHDPYDPPPPFAERFAADRYQGEIAFVDAALARLEVGLAATLKIEDVLFVVIADHGEGLGDHGEDTHGFFLYESTVRVPFIVAGPRVPPARLVAAPVSCVDVVPTVLDRIGLRVPEGLDGRAIDLAGTKGGSVPRIYMETELPLHNYGWSPLRAVVDGALKYIDAPRPELYDLKADPAETADLARSMPEEASQLREWLSELPGRSGPPAGRSPIDPRLQSLGYVGTAAPPGAGARVDPKDRLRTYQAFQRASRALEGGRAAEALTIVDRLLGTEDTPGLRFQRARALRMQGRLGDAWTELDRAVAGGGDFPGVHMERTRIAIARGDAATTLVEVERHLVEAPDDPEALLFRGAARELSGAPAAAESDYRQALKLNPLFSSASLRLAALYVRAGRIAEARATLHQHLTLHPEDRLARGLLDSI